MSSALDLRQQGNYQFSEENYEAAVALYTAALEIANSDNDELVLNLCNRSACYYQMLEYEKSRDDAQQALQVDGTNKKAVYRLAKALGQLQEYEQAIEIIDKINDQALLDLKKQLQRESVNPKTNNDETDVRFVKRPVSIREFLKGKALGYGNFSEVHIVTHKQTKQVFALKSITKKQAADLAKRQHPNVYNEINMERRVLLERLPAHEHVIQMYHAFQDYNTIYYLMDLHVEWSDLWSQVRYSSPDNDDKDQFVMVGSHRSQARVWIAQLIDAVEHLALHGIVHRDIKPENVLLNSRGHVVLIDFGTAKDLIQTDLNGPEFVGTPDFMSPEAVGGHSSMEKQQNNSNKNEATHAADLWAVGATLYLLETGQTPFWSPSPYLAFIRIQRGLLTRPSGIVDDDAWDLIKNLMQIDPNKRLGADAFTVKDGKVQQLRSDGYDIIRKHEYFRNITPDIKKKTPVPSLRDLCVRHVAQIAYNDAHDVDILDNHPPGDGSRHDMTRLLDRDQAAVLWVLDRQKRLQDERVWSRFFTNDVQRRLNARIRSNTHDFVGLTQMNDDQVKPPKATMNDPYAKPVEATTIQFVQITNPLFDQQTNEACDEETRKSYIKLLKRSIATVNKKRPRLVVAAGYLDEKCRKFLARISDSIPVVAHDGTHYFTFWQSGVQCIALQSTNKESLPWLREQFELCRLSKQPLFIFCNNNLSKLPMRLQKQMARGRTLMLSGIANCEIDTTLRYLANEKVDDASIKSTDSDEDEADEFTMRIVGTNKSGLRWFTIEEEPDKWKSVFEEIVIE